MKPANFPERKRQRQIGALKRLQEQIARKPAGANRDALRSRADALVMLIPAGSQRDKRTKKDRSQSARFTRGQP